VTDPTRRLAPVVRLAPAKLNLTLAVVGRRPDGFHTLHAVMAPLGLADRLSVAVTSAAADTIHVDGAPVGCTPVDWPPERDLVLRAIAAARHAVGPGRRVGGPAPPLAARLEKRIPVAAGLGGGSSDAAAALDAADEAWSAELDPPTLARLAAELGSDVPFFLAGGIALVEGRGEVVTRLPAPIGPPPGLLLVTPRLKVLTPDVFAAFAQGARPAGHGAARATSEHLAGELRAGLTADRLIERAGVLAAANDLVVATAAVVPAVVPFRRALFRLLGRPVGQSGSGPTLWSIYPSLEAAEAGAVRVREALAARDLDAPGDGPPAVIATTIAGEASGTTEAT
jgi:4-diphosphocytidyl-2-C-methyl-D-erythritol kinase